MPTRAETSVRVGGVRYSRPMARRDSVRGPRTYARAVTFAGLQSVLTGAWVAAAELPPGRRRLARAGIVAAIATSGAAGGDFAFKPPGAPEPAARQAGTSDAGAPAGVPASGSPPAGQPELWMPGTAVAVGVSLSTALLLGSKRLQRRWLDRLARGGHRHPHRALGVRIAALSFVGSLPAEVLQVHEARRRRPSATS